SPPPPVCGPPSGGLFHGRRVGRFYNPALFSLGRAACRAARQQHMAEALLHSSIRSLPLLARGKVRDNYAVGDDRILMIASDRLSAFDVVMGEPIPGKGELLTQMALFWFAHLQRLVPNHLTGNDPASVVPPDERDQVRGRSMLVKRLKPLPVEAV